MLPIGKIPNDILKKVVFKYLGVENKKIIDGAHIAGDTAIVDFDSDKYLAIKTDPITGAIKNIGKHSIIINSNDMAARGAIPKYFLATILLPPKSTVDDLETICKDMNEAAIEYNISIIGGHSEVSPTVNNPVVVGLMIGEINRDNLLLAKNIEVGDKIILIKSVGIEGCSIIGHDHYKLINNSFSEKIIFEAKNLINEISILKESLLIRKMKGIKFMHDPTEGGLIGGLIEICDLINKGFTIYEKEIIIYNCVRIICKRLKINPLRLLSSGALIVICNPENSKEIINKINKSGIEAKDIGEITVSSNNLVLKNGNIQELGNNIYEELWLLDTEKI